MSQFRYTIHHKKNKSVRGQTRTLHVNVVADLKEEKAADGTVTQKVVLREIARASVIWDDAPHTVTFEDPKDLVLIDELMAPVIDLSEDEEGDDEEDEKAVKARENLVQAVDQLIDADQLAVPSSILKQIVNTVGDDEVPLKAAKEKVLALLANHPEQREIMTKTFEVAAAL